MTDSPASHYLEAALLPRNDRGLRRLWRWALWVGGNLFLGDGPAVADLVVTRKDSGAEVMRTPADVGSAEHLLDVVRDDLANKSVIEFFSEWRILDDGTPPSTQGPSA